MSNPSITADKTPWYQWDTGLTVTVSGGEMTECHFANRKQGTAYVQAVINGIARVPDELLQVSAPIKAYGYVSDGAGGQTYVEQTFDVIARNIPADYTYTKTAQKTIRDAEAARDEAVQAAKDAKTSALAADDSAVDASKSAKSAGEYESAASTSASNAATSASNAAKSASDAKTAADKAVEDASKLLKTYTDNAKTSADNAATSARNAADAASAASGSASAAEQSATDASNAKVAAQTAKDDAETAKSEAATSASNAERSATAAEKSASDAAASVNAINVIAPKNVDIVPTMVGGDSLAIGRGAKASDNGNYSVVIGSRAHAHSIGTIAIGPSAADTVDTKGQNVIIGDNAKVNGAVAGSIVFGSYSIATKDAEMSIGHPANDTGIGETTREITHVSEPTAPSSASTKKYTDDNDAKTLTEAKKYTDANTSNALVGNVSGKLLHVEDAWPGKPLGLTLYGNTVQADGTPTPENPLPLRSAGPTGVVSCGKNLFDVSEESLTEKYARGVYTINDGAISFSASNDWGGDYMYFNRANVDGNRLTFSMKWSGDEVGANNGARLLLRLYSETGDMITLSPEKVFGYALSQFQIYNSFYKGYPIRSGYTNPISFEFLESAGVAYAVLGVCVSSNTIGVPIKIWDVQLEVSDAATSYAQYNGASASLPEGLVLRSLPDGTRDEYDPSTGTVTRRVGSVVLDGETFALKTGAVQASTGFYYAYAKLANYAVGSINQATADNRTFVKDIPTCAENVGSLIITSIGNVCVGVGSQNSTSEALRASNALLSADPTTILYKLDTPTVEHVAPVTLPDVRGPVGNVCAESVSVSTPIKVEYKRDINVAFENLVQAVVAAAAGE